MEAVCRSHAPFVSYLSFCSWRGQQGGVVPVCGVWMCVVVWLPPTDPCTDEKVLRCHRRWKEPKPTCGSTCLWYNMVQNGCWNSERLKLRTVVYQTDSIRAATVSTLFSCSVWRLWNLTPSSLKENCPSLAHLASRLLLLILELPPHPQPSPSCSHFQTAWPVDNFQMLSRKAHRVDRAP